MDIDAEQLPLGMLLNTLGRELFETTQRAMADAPVDIIGLGMLWLISLDPGRAQGDYARFLHRDPTTFGRHVDRLESAGYLRRCAIAGDRRARALGLTESGKAVLAEGRARAMAIEDQLTGGRSSDARQIKRMLAEMLCTEATRQPVPCD